MVAGKSTASFHGDVANDGDIFTGQGSQSVFFGEVTGSGNFPGLGIVEFAGSVSPGNSPGAVSFGGDVVLGATATTLMELAGVTDGDYDQLQVAGILEVGGGLAVELLDGFVPLPRPISRSSMRERCRARFRRCCFPTCRACWVGTVHIFTATARCRSFPNPPR